MVRKHFNAVYKTIVTGKDINVYEEYTEEYIRNYYEESKKWEKRSLEELLKVYVGKPKMSLVDFKTSNDIIKWYATCKDLEKKLYTSNFDEIKEVLNNE